MQPPPVRGFETVSGSQIRRRGLRRRRERVQSEDTRYRRQLWAPRAPSPRTRVATEARGWRSTFRRSIARLVPQPGQNTSSHGVPAISAARIVGDHNMSRLAASLLVPAHDDALRLGTRSRSATCPGAPLIAYSPHLPPHWGGCGRMLLALEMKAPAGDRGGQELRPTPKSNHHH